MPTNLLTKEYTYVPGAVYEITVTYAGYWEVRSQSSTITFFPYDSSGNYQPSWDSAAYVRQYYTNLGYTVLSVDEGDPHYLELFVYDQGTLLTSNYWTVTTEAQNSTIWHPGGTVSGYLLNQIAAATSSYTINTTFIGYAGDPAIAAIDTSQRMLQYGPSRLDIDIGWNSGAESYQVLQNGELTFSVGESSVGIAIGIGSVDATRGYAHIQRGWLFINDSARGLVSGVGQSPQTTVSGTDVWGVRIVNGIVTLTKNGAFFQELAPLEAGVSYQVYAALYVSGDAIYDAQITQLAVQIGAAAGAATATGIAAARITASAAGAAAATGTIDAYKVGDVWYTSAYGTGAATGVANARVRATAAGAAVGAGSTTAPTTYEHWVVSTQPLLATGEHLSRAEGVITAPSPIVSGGQYEYQPAFAVGQMTLPTPMVFGVGYEIPYIANANDASIDVTALQAIGSQTAYGAGTLRFQNFWATGGYRGSSVRMTSRSPGWSINAIATVQPPLTMTGTIDLTASTMSARTGCVLRATSPGLSISAHANVPLVARLDETYNLTPTASAHAYTGSNATMQAATSLTGSIAAYTGAVLRGTYSSWSISAHAIQGVSAELNATVSNWASMTASATTGRLASLQATYDLDPQSVWTVMRGSMDLAPRSYAYAIPTTLVSSAYVVVAKDGKTSVYTNYDFDAMGLLNDGQTYMVSSTGVYVRGGSLDVGARIAALAETGDMTFGADQDQNWENNAMKRMPYIYVISYNDNIKITQYADDGKVNSYHSSLGNKRVQCSKGARGVHWRLRFENITGRSLNLARVEMLVEQLSRRI